MAKNSMKYLIKQLLKLQQEVDDLKTVCRIHSKRYSDIQLLVSDILGQINFEERDEGYFAEIKDNSISKNSDLGIKIQKLFELVM